MKRLKIIDLFAGIGGIRQGFTLNNCQVVYSSEKDEFAKQTYFANYNELPHGDITTVKAEDIPSFDILCAGFPCQPFSQVGLKKGFSDTRGTLFFDIARILDYHKPRAFFLENVRNLEKHDNGKTFNIIKETLSNMGYTIFYKIVKASDYGLPQHRPRLFIIGVLNDKKKNFKFPPKIPLKYTMSDIFNAPCTREIGFTLRVGGRGSNINDRRNWDHYYVNNEVIRISSKYAKLMQGFDKDFNFPVSETQAMKQLGNSVAIDAVYNVAKSLIDYLEGQEYEKI